MQLSLLLYYLIFAHST